MEESWNACIKPSLSGVCFFVFFFFPFFLFSFFFFLSASCVLMDSVAFRSATVYNLEMTVSWSRPKQDGVFRVFTQLLSKVIVQRRLPLKTDNGWNLVFQRRAIFGCSCSFKCWPGVTDAHPMKYRQVTPEAKKQTQQ